MAEVITLNSILKENSEALLLSGDFEKTTRLKEQAIRESKALGNLIFTSCKHNLLSLTSMIDITDAAKTNSSIHLENESGCPLCRTPYNLYLPVFSIDALNILNKTPPKAKAQVDSYSARDLLDDLRAVFLRNGAPLLISTDLVEKAAVLKLYQENSSDCERVVSQIVTNFILYTDAHEKATGRGLSKFPAGENLIANSLTEVLKYLDLYGLAQATKDLAQTYHSLFLVLRLRHLQETLADQLDQEGRVVDRSEALASQMSRVAKRVITGLLSCCEKRPEFIYADLEKAYAAVLIEIVSSGYTVRTGPQRGAASTGDQARVRHVPQRKDPPAAVAAQPAL